MAWRPAKSIVKLLAQLNAAHPKRSKASDGTIGNAAHASRTSDHNPWIKDGAVGVVTAVDITHDPGDGMDCGKLAQSIMQSKDRRVKYMIFNKRIMAGNGGPSPWKWRPYSGSNPHTKHMHVSVETSKALYDNTSAWDITVGSFASKPKPKPSTDYEAYRKNVKPGSRTVKLGNAGDDVAHLQRFIGRSKADGYYGPGTVADVKWYQNMRGLGADGVCGPKTWQAVL